MEMGVIPRDGLEITHSAPLHFSQCVGGDSHQPCVLFSSRSLRWLSLRRLRMLAFRLEPIPLKRDPRTSLRLFK
jgi:hypothetical protein